MNYSILLVHPPSVDPDPDLAREIMAKTHGRVATRQVQLTGDDLDGDRVVGAVMINGIPDAVIYLPGALPLTSAPPLRMWLMRNPAYKQIRCETIRGNAALVAHRIALWLVPHPPDPREPPAEHALPPPEEPEWLDAEVEAAVQHLTELIRSREPWLRRLTLIRDQSSGEYRTAVDRVPKYARFRGAPAHSSEVGEATRDLRGPSSRRNH